MNTELQTFNFNELTLETITDNNGEIWFLATPLAKFLDYKNPAEAIRTNVDIDEVQKIYIPTKSNSYTFINESGLYSLVFRSNKPEAKAFKKWVTNEVLPSIRKNGTYSVQPKVELTRLELIQMAMDSELEKQALQITVDQQIQVIKTKDDLIRVSNEASVKAGEILVRELVKSVDTIDLGEKQFYQWLRDQHLIFPDRNEPYQPYINAGYFTWKPSDKEINGKIRYQLRITPRGKIWLASRYMAWYDSRAQLHLPTEKRNGLASINGGEK